MPEQRRPSSYGQILKSSAVVGSASLLNALIGMVRTKAIAVMLGPSGVGLLGLYGSIADVTRSVAEMGINGSGVRQIAEAASTGDNEKIARTANVLRLTSIALGTVGALLLILFTIPITVLTFDTREHVAGVALLSIVVFLRLIGDGQRACLQGLRHIGYVARINVFGSLFGTAASIAVIYFLRENGIVLSLILVAAWSLLVSWIYSQKVALQRVTTPFREIFKEAQSLLRLGFAFMVSGFLVLGLDYAVRLIVMRTDGTVAAGLYQAAWTLGGLYVSFVLQAMGTDFYPRLVGVKDDDTACSQLVNEQAHVSMLMTGPGVLATMTAAPLVLPLFYSAEFVDAVDLLRWICLGMALRVVTWPVGFIVVARGLQRIFLATELVWTFLNIGLAWVCVQTVGLVGAGMAFFISNVIHGFLVVLIVRRVANFRWSASNTRYVTLYLLSLLVAFCSLHFFNSTIGISIGAAVTVLVSLFCFLSLIRLFPLNRLPKSLQRALGR